MIASGNKYKVQFEDNIVIENEQDFDILLTKIKEAFINLRRTSFSISYLDGNDAI